MDRIKEEFKNLVPGILFDEPLAPYSTFQIGGPADMFYKLTNNEELPSLIELCRSHKIPYFVFGSGSNILFDDKGFRGIIIKIESKNLEFTGETVTADAGVIIASLIEESLKEGLTGLEKWVGLPGTVGGAVRGNAGCNGLETKDVLVAAMLYDPSTAKINAAKCAYFDYDYRYSKIKTTDVLVLSATFKLKKSRVPIEKQREEMTVIRKDRVAKQPFGLTTGSFFKNPDEEPAGKLIDEAGLKGRKVGEAQISEKHGNFFINTGGATYQDIIGLAELAKREVKANSGIELEEEVQILSEKGMIKLAKI